MPHRPTVVTAAAVGFLLALVGTVPAAAAPIESSPLRVTFPEDGATLSSGDVTLRGSVAAPDQTTNQTTRVQYVVDVSGSTGSPVQDCNGDGVRDVLDDFNGDGRFGDVLDCEISAVVALNASLRSVPASADHLEVGLTAFGSTATAAQMERDEPDSLFVQPGLTGDDKDVIPNLNFVASSLRQGTVGEYASRSVGTGTDFDAALTTALDAFGSHSGTRWIFFLSDGQASVRQATLDRVRASGVRVRTFAVGGGTGTGPCAPAAPLGAIAAAGGDSCVRVSDPSALAASVVDSQPAWLTSVTVEVDGRTVPADIDPIGGWSATVPGLADGRHRATVTATLADGTTWTTGVGFRIAGDQISYTALGDSYAAGEGVRPYLVAQHDDALCHRSANGWPMLVGLGDDPEPLSRRDDVTFRFLACSGARIDNLDTTPQPKKWGAVLLKGEAEVPLQLDALDSDADLVTLSIGGNDLGFASIVTHCVTTLSCPEHGFISTDSGTSVILDDWTTVRLALIGNELTGAYEAVRARVRPDTTVVATTYPRLVSVSPLASVNVTCTAPVLSHGERQWLRAQVDTFAAIVHERARRPGAGIQVVDVRDHFEGRNACDRDAHIYGATLIRLDDLTPGAVSAASFHPTARGARLYAAAVTEALHDTSRPGPRAGEGVRNRAETHADEAWSDAAIVTDPDAVLRQYPPDVVDAVGATTFADAYLGNGAALDGQPACEDVVTGEVVPLLAHEFAPGSVVTASTVAVAADGTETGRATSTHHADDDGLVRSAVIAPEVAAAGLLSVSLTGVNAGGGPVVGTALASTSVDASCRATVAEAGRLGPQDGDGDGTVAGVGRDTDTPSASPDRPGAHAPAAALTTTGAHLLPLGVAALVLLAVGGAVAVAGRRHGRSAGAGGELPR